MGIEENKEVVRRIVVEEYIPGYPEFVTETATRAYMDDIDYERY